MSRSRRKNKIFGMTKADSEKQDKRLANRAMRRIIKQSDFLNEDLILPIMDEVRNIWSMDKDGKHYWADATKKDMRK
jgi:hypothetical protein